MLSLSLGAIFLALLAALIGGLIDAIAGGGGLIVLPSLLLTGLPPHVAVSCNKFSASLGTLMAVLNFARSKLILWKLALLGLPLSLLGAYLGTRLALTLSPDFFGKILIGLLPVAMLLTFIQPKSEDTQKPPKLFWMPIICVLIGCYDGFFGPATGSFLILACHHVLKINFLEASATAKVLNLASNLSSTLTFIAAGTMWWALALPMALASIAGNFIGSKLAIKLGSKLVRRFLLVSLCLLLITLIYKFI
ncbi:MAG: TSUP family transporter [Desulfovibrionaceae bacterium]|nr:TSUP family transporter [Desulfovibrionaceae bacterium]